MKVKLLLTMLLLTVGIAFSGCGNSVSNTSEPQNVANKTKSVSNVDFEPVKEAGLYKEIIMQPNGVFLAKDKADDSEILSAGLLYKVETDDNGRISKITLLYNGAPINLEWTTSLNETSESFAAVTIEYQDNDYVKYYFKNSRMKPAVGYYGSYAIRFRKDGDTVKIAYLYDKEDKHAANSYDYAQMIFTYDDKGKLSKIGYANAQGERITNWLGQYELRLKYDKWQQPIEIANYGKDNSMKVDKEEIAKVVYKFDEQGRIIEAAVFGGDDTPKVKKCNIHPVLTEYGLGGAITRYAYEENENNERTVTVSFFGKDNQPIGIKEENEVSSFKLTFSPEGLKKSGITFGVDGTPLARGDKYVKIVRTYDKYGNIVSIAFYGKDDVKIVSKKEHCAELRFKHDEKRRPTEVSYWGTAEEPIDVPLYGKNIHKIIVEEYDDNNDNIILAIAYDKNGNEVMRHKETDKDDIMPSS